MNIQNTIQYPYRHTGMYICLHVSGVYVLHSIDLIIYCLLSFIDS